MGLDKHKRVSTYGRGPSSKEMFNQYARMFDVELIREELLEEMQEELREELREELEEELREEIRAEMQEVLRQEIQVEIQEELRVIRDEVRSMKEEIETIRTCMEKAGLTIPSTSGQVVGAPTAQQPPPLRAPRNGS